MRVIRNMHFCRLYLPVAPLDRDPRVHAQGRARASGAAAATDYQNHAGHERAGLR